jgi:hypothetical protein
MTKQSKFLTEEQVLKNRKKSNLYYYKNHAKELIRQKAFRDRRPDFHWEHTYGMKPGDRKNLLESQDNLCAICKKNLIGIKYCVDHDHTTKKIRGILCNECNTGLGKFKDSLQLLKEVVLYLEKDLVKP